MSELQGVPPRDSFVPASFEDLRRNTEAEGEAVARRREEQLRTREDFADLVTQGGFMRQSKWIGLAGLAIGALLILAVYFKPLFQTADAVQTAATTAESGGVAQFGGVGRLAGQADALRRTDMKAIDMAKGGLGCLTGKAGCPGGGSSPFR